MAPNDLSGLLRENATLMLQIGKTGVDARVQESWKAKAKEATALMRAQKTMEASLILSTLNAEIRSAIQETQGQ